MSAVQEADAGCLPVDAWPIGAAGPVFGAHPALAGTVALPPRGAAPAAWVATLPAGALHGGACGPAEDPMGPAKALAVGVSASALIWYALFKTLLG